LSDPRRRAGDMDRRSFLGAGASATGALAWCAALQTLAVRRTYCSAVGVSPYGPIGPVADESSGLDLLQLPTASLTSRTAGPATS
jgi:hypothetical protein